MKKVLIVDDEMLVRAGIRSLIDWQSHGYELVGEAVNGGDALAQIPEKRPDIILTDLVMDGGDGISLIRECRAKWPSISCIVLSNYNDFDHVRQAMKEGAKDFLFKLTMSGDELLKVLDAQNIDSGAQSVEPDRNLVRERVGRMLVNHEYHSLSDILPVIRSARFVLDGEAWFCVMRIVVCGVRENDLDLTNLATVISDTTKAVFPRHDALQTSRGVIHLLFNTERDTLTEGLEKRIVDLWAQIEHQISRWWGCSSYALAGEPVRGWEMVGKEARRCLQAEEALYTSPEPHLAFLRDIPPLSERVTPDESLSPGLWKALLASGNRESAKAFLKRLFQWLEDQRATRFSIRGLLQQYALIWEEQAASFGIDLASIEDSMGRKLLPTIASSELLSDVASCFQSVFDGYLVQRADAPGKAMRPAVSRAVLWIKSHPDAQISVEELAGQAHMSASYFAHMFKEDTGVPLMKYVQEHRLAYARVLIETTDLPISRLCAMAGIPNANYFSALFRKKYGSTPLEWRTKKQDSII